MMSNVDKIVRSTVQVASWSNAGMQSTGSGALLQIHPDPDNADRVALVVVTNRHVVAGAARIAYWLPGAQHGSKIRVDVQLSGILFHPDQHIDLAILPVPEPVARKDFHRGTIISDRDVYSNQKMDRLNSIENIVMIGYPNGIVDNLDSYPISRRGVTATPPFADYNSNPDFMVDCACFPGSSGSPIFLLDQGQYVDKENNLLLGQTRVGLLGFLYAGPVMTQTGEIVRHEPPLSHSDMVKMPMMLNLGICVKAYKLFEMYPLILADASRP